MWEHLVYPVVRIIWISDTDVEFLTAKYLEKCQSI